ncbi:hypothetical protein A8L34_22370 [Bacillus sp. FJAT-27264]|uniref:hypothetical protein n=1 Tax=Paenibacillus sp. (strain DSM 101736 / FJAT-27264) TaxID=1850362 RepID=UPI000807DB10|nr:hypothetical protein [Bacillus sp. FJAT-27264]OBZ08901.1 hypothetical protein A8L34_22370 [Bacillus sp. FJAT-27264]
MTDDQQDWYIEQIRKLRSEADKLAEDSPGALVEKIRLLTTAHMYMGRVSARKDGDHAKVYVARKRAYVEVMRSAPKGNKSLAAEEAIIPLREIEAEALEQKTIWRNELDSLKEKIYELRMRVRIDTHIGGGING